MHASSFELMRGSEEARANMDEEVSEDAILYTSIRTLPLKNEDLESDLKRNSLNSHIIRRPRVNSMR